jgi:hypothetical protein
MSILVLLGPRVFIILWWIYNPDRWDRAFSTVLWPLLGVVFAPWTTLMYVSVQPRGVDGFDWFWIALAALADLASYAGGGFGNRDRVAAYARR